MFDADEIRSGEADKRLRANGGIQGLAIQCLKSNLKDGINETDKEELTAREMAFGKNIPYRKEARTIMEMICDVFGDTML
jgi:hypothetical protein